MKSTRRAGHRGPEPGGIAHPCKRQITDREPLRHTVSPMTALEGMLRPFMLALALTLSLAAAPTGEAKKLVGIWMDHGSPYAELRPDGSGRIGPPENNWSVEGANLHVVLKESGDSFDIPFTLEKGGKELKLIVQGTTVLLEKSKQKPLAKAPPPPKTPSQIEAGDSADAGTKTKKKGKK